MVALLCVNPFEADFGPIGPASEDEIAKRSIRRDASRFLQIDASQRSLMPLTYLGV